MFKPTCCLAQPNFNCYHFALYCTCFLFLWLLYDFYGVEILVTLLADDYRLWWFLSLVGWSFGEVILLSLCFSLLSLLLFDLSTRFLNRSSVSNLEKKCPVLLIELDGVLFNSIPWKASTTYFYTLSILKGEDYFSPGCSQIYFRVSVHRIGVWGWNLEYSSFKISPIELTEILPSKHVYNLAAICIYIKVLSQ